MKKKLSKIIASLLCCAMVISMCGVVSAASDDKVSETVYVTLESNGSTKEIIAVKGGAQQRDITGELPFNIKITYTWDKKEVVPQDILGMSGDVKIKLDITPNAKTKSFYKDNLALQMQFPLDMENITDLKAEGLTGVMVGNTKTLSGIVLPAKSASYVIEYKTENFKLGSINFVCMPFDVTGMVDIDMSDIGTQVTKLQTGLSQYVDGVAQIDNGAIKANDGLKNLAGNKATIDGGYAKLQKGQSDLINGVIASLPPEVKQAMAPQLAELQKQMAALDAASKQYEQGLKQYTAGVAAASAGIDQLSKGLNELAKQGTLLNDGVTTAIKPLSSLESTFKKDTTSPISFISSDEVSEIQFVMKTDALSKSEEKVDVVQAKAKDVTFWDRLVALFIK